MAASNDQPTTATPEASKGGKSDDLLDRVEDALDIDREDEEMRERLKNPFVRYAVASFIVLLFLIFITYFLSFILEKPLPEAKFLEHFLDVIIDAIKMFLGG